MKNAKAHEQKTFNQPTNTSALNLAQNEPIRSMDNDKLLTNILFYDYLFTKPKNSPNSKFFVSRYVPYHKIKWNPNDTFI